ncbi:MAG: hypothetical protein B9S34_09195 [Opitutia bacterium Tous-C1TDCM]|nr:MAG: hypothetical protein B9S34_09195 [Opitutae bacterium Tous-C1TDCM]
MSFCFFMRSVAGACRFTSALRRFQALLGLLAAICLPAAAAAAPAAVLRVGFEQGAEPMSFADAAGKPAGFSVDLVNAIAAEMNLTVVPVLGPWDVIFGRFKAGEIDVLASLAYTPERDAYIDFSVSHLRLEGRVFVRRDETRLRTIADLGALRLGVQPQSFSHEYLRRRGLDAELVAVATLPEALRSLAENRSDAVLAVGLVGQHIIRREQMAGIVASPLPLPDFEFRLHMGVPAGAAAHLALLNEGLARIRQNGTYDRIHGRWLGPLESRPLRLSDVRRFLPWTLVLVAAVAMAFLWQRRLLRRLARQKARLAESEERLRHVLEGSEDGFWDWDIRAGRIERSERWAAMLGYRVAEIDPSIAGGSRLIHPEDAAAYRQWQERILSGSTERYEIEYRMRAKSGEWRWVLDRGKVVARDAAGRPLRMAGTHTDIAERKRTESALIESQSLLKRSAQLLQQTQAAAHIGGWETDLRTGRVYWTSETFRLHETTPEEFQPTREAVYEFYVPESRAQLQAAAERAIRDGTPYGLELELVTAKGRRLHVHTTGMAEREDGRPVKLYGSFRDITAEKAAHQEREKMRLKMLETQKLESLGVLAGGIAHDFNNLLTVILANATFLRSEGRGDGALLAHIEAASRRAADLCRQMLAYAGKGSFVLERVELAELVRDTAHLIQVSIGKKARLELELAAGLPAVEADVSQLRQVLMNLVINAAEALGDDAGTIRIATRLERPETAPPAGLVQSFDIPAGACVCLEVSDTGCGMSPATLPRIFDPFFTTKFAGRGLGLPAVLGIVRSHRGALAVQSRPGGGSIFRLYLPAAQPRPAAAAGTRNPFAGPRAEGAVLVADDEPIVLQTTAAVLRHQGFRTVLAADGNEAVARFREAGGDFSAVLLDLTMPGIDGAEAARAIRAIDPAARILVMSGFSEQDVFARLRGLGNVTVLRKPFSRDTLLANLAAPKP